MFNNLLKRLVKKWVGYSYYHYIESPIGALCIVEKVKVGFIFTTYTPICYCSKPFAQMKVDSLNKLIGNVYE